MSELNRLVRTPLTPDELRNLWRTLSNKPAPPVVNYNDIINARNINDVFNGKDAIIIFYPVAESNGGTFGHYVALIKDEDDHTIYFYDSYGGFPDSGIKKFVDRRLYNEKNNSLIKHLLSSGYKVDYSPYPHQKTANKSATCGRHSLNRIFLKHLNNEEYNRRMKKVTSKLKTDPDNLVSKIWN